MTDKVTMRRDMRILRRDHAAAIPGNVRALLFKQPPTPLMNIVHSGATIGLYHAKADEAPAAAYAKHFSEMGHQIALPRFVSSGSAMEFALHTDPFGETDLEEGPFGLMQPTNEAATVIPNLIFVPLIAFTDSGERLGQGGGHYDRWLAANPFTKAVGIAWDCQLADTIPTEGHDVKLGAVVTPTRLYGPF